MTRRCVEVSIKEAGCGQGISNTHTGTIVSTRTIHHLGRNSGWLYQWRKPQIKPQSGAMLNYLFMKAVAPSIDGQMNKQT